MRGASPIAAALLGALALAASACTEETEALYDPGLHMKLRAQGAQLLRGGLSRDEGGPTVTTIQRMQPTVRRGEADVTFAGDLAPGGVVIHIQAEGDPDHWVVNAGSLDAFGTQLIWSTNLEFSHDIAGDSLKVFLQALDEHGKAGPVAETSFDILADPPAAKLVVSLAWDAAVDLDLHVTLPNGVDVSSKNINSHEPPPPGTVDPPGAWMDGAYLELDSNKHCELDLRNVEHVLWINTDPAPGKYRVYADLFSPCKASVVNFEAVVRRNGEATDKAASSLYRIDSDLHPRAGEAPGLFLLEFVVE